MAAEAVPPPVRLDASDDSEQAMTTPDVRKINSQQPASSDNEPDRSGHPGHLTAEQAEALAALAAQFADQELPPRWRTDDMFCRFLRARNFDLALTSAMLNDCLAWRRDFAYPGGIDALLHFEFPEEQAVRAAYPECYHKTDRFGRPVLLQLVGRIDLVAVKAATDWDRLRQFNLHRMEHNIQVKYPACSEMMGAAVGESCIIIDLKGLRPWMFTSEIREYLKSHFKILQDNYPERLGKMFVINAPTIFAGIWAVLKKFVDPKTRNKVEILGSRYKAKLCEVIDEATLPTFLGGLDESFDPTIDQGPWLKAAGARLAEAPAAPATVAPAPAPLG